MQTRFGPDDEDAFFAARDEILEAYRTAAGPEDDPDPSDGAFVAGTMLEHKWGYGDGRIYDWRKPDIEDLLLGHFPRKVTVDVEDLDRVPGEVVDFLSYLDRRGLLTGDPLADLAATARSLRPPFIEAMRDERNFGTAKTFVDQMVRDGVDLSDQAAIEAWIATYNAAIDGDGGIDRQGAIDGDGESGLDDPLGENDEPLPLIELPPLDELRVAASESPLVAQLTAFTRYIGAGRPLTQRGNLTLADGRALVELLGTNEVEGLFPDDPDRVRSTGDLIHLNRIVEWARAAGYVKVRHGRMSATRRGTALGRDPLADWRAAFDGLQTGDIFGLRGSRRMGYGPFWADVHADLTAELPELAYREGELEVEQVKTLAWQLVSLRYYVPDDNDAIVASLRRMVGDDVEDRIIGPLVELGAATLVDGRVRLTPLGLWAVNRRLREEGAVAPISGELRDASAGELLEGCAWLSLDDADREIRGWIDGRPATAARELAEAARTGPLPALALHALTLAGPAAEAEVRGLQGNEHVGLLAEMWLVEQGYDHPSSLRPETLQAVFLHALVGQVDAGDIDEAMASFAGLGTDAEQIEFLEGFLHNQHPRTNEMLWVIGSHHPSKVVAKAARKLAFRRGARPH